MPTSYLILDIETIPDRSIWQPEKSISPKPLRFKLPKKAKEKNLQAEVDFLNAFIDYSKSSSQVLHPDDIDKAIALAESMERHEDAKFLAGLAGPAEKEEFAPHYAHRVLVIGAVWLDSHFNVKKIGAIVTGAKPEMTEGERDDAEQKALTDWATFMNDHKPVIVDYNGRSFDLPVLVMRCLRHGIPLPWYFDNRDYRYRYSEAAHLDLCDAFTNFGATKQSRLDALSRLVGLPGKPSMNGEQVDGSKVEEMFRTGRLEDIAIYCKTDCLQTTWLFLRWCLLKGRFSREEYKSIAHNLFDEASKNPSLKFFTDSINLGRLLFE